MNLVLFDDHSWENLLPLTFTRPVSSLRVGILTLAEKWEWFLGSAPAYLTRPHLQDKYPSGSGTETLFINGSLLPDREISEAIEEMDLNSAIKQGNTLLAVKTDQFPMAENTIREWSSKAKEYARDCHVIDFPWRIFQLNGKEIVEDYQLITAGRESCRLSSTVNVINPEKVFAEEGFKGEHITLNAAGGPIYLGKDSEIMEGSVIRGPFSLGEGSTVKLSAKIYGATTIGPACKVGGEVNNAVIYGNSSKSHDGFLGNAVIGEWCNLGADTNNSNLKNNYSEVKLWNYPERGFIKTGLQYCGLIMGDHSKCGINTMFNTGTVVGVSANIFGSGFPRNFIPSFSWGGATEFSTYRLEKAFETIALVMERRGEELTKIERAILEFVFQSTEEYRT